MSTISKKLERLKALEEQIEKEKTKIEGKLGKEILSSLNIDYDAVTPEVIEQITSFIKNHSAEILIKNEIETL